MEVAAEPIQSAVRGCMRDVKQPLHGLIVRTHSTLKTGMEKKRCISRTQVIGRATTSPAPNCDYRTESSPKPGEWERSGADRFAMTRCRALARRSLRERSSKRRA